MNSAYSYYNKVYSLHIFVSWQELKLLACVSCFYPHILNVLLQIVRLSFYIYYQSNLAEFKEVCSTQRGCFFIYTILISERMMLLPFLSGVLLLGKFFHLTIICSCLKCSFSFKDSNNSAKSSKFCILESKLPYKRSLVM